MPRRAIAGLYGKCMFGFLRNCQTLLQCDCTILNSCQQLLRDLASYFSCFRGFLVIPPYGIHWRVPSGRGDDTLILE